MQSTAIVVLALSCTLAGCNREPQAAAFTASRNVGSAPATVTSSASESAAVDQSAAARPEESSLREMTLPAGTELPLVLDTPVASDTSRIEQIGPRSPRQACCRQGSHDPPDRQLRSAEW